MDSVNPSLARLREWALHEVKNAVRALPQRLRQQVQSITVICEAHPSPALREDGLEADTLGLFVGESWEEASSTASPLPPQIILYVGNLWDYAGKNDAEFRREVRRTYLHELGHFLGLDEDDLGLRDLD